jgi:4-hydroxyphenylpyruvate dioxygenase
VDSVEWAVKSLSDAESKITNWGFKKLAAGKIGSNPTALWGQGKIKFIITQGDSGDAAKFVKKHGDGICDVTFLVDDAAKAAETVSGRGAKVVCEPKKESAKKGQICRSAIASFGSVTHSFISRHDTTQFNPVFDVDTEVSPEGFGMFSVDHLTCNLAAGDLDRWAEFYEKIFQFKQTRFFNISTGRTGLLSKVMENQQGTVKLPLNEPTDKKSQIQEYLDINQGPGVQHLALATGDIVETLKKLRKAGQKFLDVPDTYYEEVPKRVKGIQEDLNVLKAHRILADGDTSGYLLQIFSENAIGPFFYEVIQRHGNQGFGEGNFRALFEAIERDQERRGVL